MIEALLFLTGGIGILLTLLMFLLLITATVRWLKEQQAPKANHLVTSPMIAEQTILSSRDKGSKGLAFQTLIQHLSDLGTFDNADHPSIEGQLGNVKKMLDTRTGQHWLCVKFQAGDEKWTEFHLLKKSLKE